VTRRRSHPAGALLLEAVVALAVLVGFGAVILASVSDARARLDAARRQVLAQDLAACAVAELAAGLRQAEEMSGPVRNETRGGSGTSLDDGARESGWELAVETAPGPGAYDGLTLVTVTARETGPGGASVTLRRLVQSRSGGRGRDGAEGGGR
jgi:hypothetical protein